MTENMSEQQNYSVCKIKHSVDPELSKVCLHDDSNFSEVSNVSDSSINCTKSSEVSSQIPGECSEKIYINTDECANSLTVDSGINISESSTTQGTELIESDLCENNSALISNFFDTDVETELKNEKFFDANNFFNDPWSLDYLEHAGSSKTPSESSMARSSLYQKFDPLHAKFFPQFNIQSGEKVNGSDPELNFESGLAPDNLMSKVETGEPQEKSIDVPIDEASATLQSNTASEMCINDSQPDSSEKTLSNFSRGQSFEDLLISFDSTINDSYTDFNVEKVCDPKMYTEKDLQEALEAAKTGIHDNFSKKQQEFHDKLEQIMALSNSLLSVINEVAIFIHETSVKVMLLKEKLEMLEKENAKLQEDLKTAKEDVEGTKNSFFSFQSRYEQCKSMLKSYTEIEKNLYEQIEYVNSQLIQKEGTYKSLQLKIETLLNEANTKANNVIKGSDAITSVLKAKLRIAEIKINSLENELHYTKLENEKLKSICADLKAEIGETDCIELENF